MKQTILYLFLLAWLSIGFFACDDPYEDQKVAEPGSYEQEAKQSADFQATITTNPLTITEENIGNMLDFITLTLVPELTDTAATVEYNVILSDADGFTAYKTVDVTPDGTALKVSYEQLNDTLKALNSTLESHAAYARVLAYIVNDGTRVLYTTGNLAFDVTTCNFSPLAVNDTVVAAKNQLLAYNVLANDSDPEGDALTLLSAQGASNGTVTISGDSILYTPNTDYTGEEEITYTISDGNTTATATVYITVTGKLYYYEVTVKPWYIVGSMGNWKNSIDDIGSSLIPLNVVDGNEYYQDGTGKYVYTGYFKADDEFILVEAPGSWAKWANNGGKGINDPAKEGSDNFKVPADGYYTITLNTAENTCSIVEASITPETYSSIGLVGGMTGWADGADIVMTANEGTSNHVWYTTYTFDSESQYKFRVDGGWTTNWGSPGDSDGNTLYQYVGTSVASGKNILGTAGTYTIVFNDIDGCYYVIEK